MQDNAGNTSQSLRNSGPASNLANSCCWKSCNLGLINLFAMSRRQLQLGASPQLHGPGLRIRVEWIRIRIQPSWKPDKFLYIPNDKECCYYYFITMLANICYNKSSLLKGILDLGVHTTTGSELFERPDSDPQPWLNELNCTPNIWLATTTEQKVTKYFDWRKK